MKQTIERNVNFDYSKRFFKPRGVPLSQIQIHTVSPTELETLRLRYLQNLNQNEASERMNISQSQYQRDLNRTIKKIVGALVQGDALHIQSISKLLQE